MLLYKKLLLMTFGTTLVHSKKQEIFPLLFRLPLTFLTDIQFSMYFLQFTCYLNV